MLLFKSIYQMRMLTLLVSNCVEKNILNYYLTQDEEKSLRTWYYDLCPWYY